MSFYKIGEALVVSAKDLRPVETVLPEHFEVVEKFTKDIEERFSKVAQELRTIAPKAKDFLYFSAVMMHAAEAALYNDDGTIKKDAKGNLVTSEWVVTGDSWKWKCSDPNIKPYKNNNSDIFPSSELIKAHKEWVGKPLCLDHKSTSVDMIRGVIVDTYYDWKKHRVIALCALDKVTYPDLARKVTSKYAACVSMGTAVGRAICFDCGNVARVEAEFCEHMRRKSCYGEINVDLKPLELSIVVNGADPKAKIRYVVASAAESLENYINKKEREISKLGLHEMVDPEQISSIQKDLENILERLKSLQDTAKDVEEHEIAEEKGEEPGENSETSGDKEAFKNEINIKLANISQNLSRLQKTVEKLANNEGTNMTMKSEAYHQGGGGDNDPSVLPYPREDDGAIRKQDKQMVGQGVNGTGPVDGMHPGYSSYGETEEARKKRLQRMAEERALRRKQAVERAKQALKDKTAYHLGGGGDNDPSVLPYPKEDFDRDKDKQMVGAKPFPDVGPTDGLFPGDQEAKEKLCRAKLTAKFYKSANSDGTDNPSQDCWQVFANKRLILTATVDELTNGKSDLWYSNVANRDFGKKIINMIRAEGFEKVKGLLKGAQLTPELEPEVESESALEGEPEEVADAGGSGDDPAEQLEKALTDAENAVADARRAADALKQAPGEELDKFEEIAGELPAAASLLSFQKKLGKALSIGFKENLKKLSDRVEELRMSKHIYASKNKLSKERFAHVNKLTADACEETKQALVEHAKLKEAFVKYANGTKELMKRAQGDIHTLTPGVQESYTQHVDFEPATIEGKRPSPPEIVELPEVSVSAKPPPPSGADIEFLEDANISAKPPEPSFGDLIKKRVKNLLPGKSREERVKDLESEISKLPKSEPGLAYKAPEVKMPEAEISAKPPSSADTNPTFDENEATFGPGGEIKTTLDELAQFASEVSELTVESEATEPDLSTKEGRAIYREKLAQKALKFSPILQDAHPEGSWQVDLDSKPRKDLDRVETLEDQHKMMMDVATAPPRVRQAAEEIHRLVVSGRIDPEKDFDNLIANGLDADAVKYWKQYFGQGDAESSQFATELVKEQVTKKAAEAQEAFEAKVSRAYELAYDMTSRGMIPSERTAIKEQVKEIMGFDEKGFESMKRFVSRQAVTKQASVPQVGMMDTGGIVLPAVPAAPQGDLVTELNHMWATKKANRLAF